MKDRGLWPYLVVGSLVFLIAVRASYLLFTQLYHKPAPARVAEYSIRVRKVEDANFPYIIRVPGIISDRNVADIVSHAPGIVSYIGAPGTVLEAGDVVARLTPIDGKTKDQLMLRVTHAKELLDAERIACQNQILKGAARKLSEEETAKLERTASVRRARIDYEKAREELNAHEIQTTIKAPFKCRVDALAVSVGSGVSHSTRLCSVINLSDSNVYVECAVPYNKQSLIHPGGRATLSLKTDKGVRVLAAEVEGRGAAAKNHPYPGFCVTIKLLSKPATAQYAPKTPGDVCLIVQDRVLKSIPELAIDPLSSRSQRQLSVFRVTQTSPATAGQPARGFAELVPIKILESHYGQLAVETDYLKDGDLVSIDPILENDVRNQGPVPVLIVKDNDDTDQYAYDLELVQNVEISDQGDTDASDNTDNNEDRVSA